MFTVLSGGRGVFSVMKFGSDASRNAIISWLRHYGYHHMENEIKRMLNGPNAKYELELSVEVKCEVT